MDIETKYQAIKKLSEGSGASRDMCYHWKLRGKMPKAWQVRVFKASSGAITFEEMDMVFARLKKHRNDEKEVAA